MRIGAFLSPPPEYLTCMRENLLLPSRLSAFRPIQTSGMTAKRSAPGDHASYGPSKEQLLMDSVLANGRQRVFYFHYSSLCMEGGYDD